MRYMFGTLIVLLLISPLLVYGQGSQNIKNRAMLIDYGDRFYADSYVVPNPGSKDSAVIAVFFRMANDFLSFTKVSKTSEVRGNYSADMAVSIELRDTLGVIRQRVQWRDVAFTNTYEETNSKTDFHFGWQRLVVGPGTYVLTLEILAQKESNQKKIKLPPVSFTPKRPTRQLTPPVFGEPLEKDGKELIRLFVFSNNLPFGSNDARALVLVADTVETEYDYRIKQLPWDQRDIRWWRVNDVDGRVTSVRDHFPRVSPASSSDAAYLEMLEQPVPERPIASVSVPIPLASMVPGKYTLQLIRKNSRDTIDMRFQIVWEMMPFSLRTIDYAIESMRYICTDDQIDSLSGGSDAENREALMNWWRRQDQTATTTYNERMAEYFRRVDNAYFAFGTLSESDGARSDRGKVFILYGQPTEIKKSLTADASREIWRYAAGIKQTFTFEVKENGRYKLIDVK